MIYRNLGTTGLNISFIGMGCSGIGKNLHRRNDKESIYTLQEAFQSGINFFDTAPNYSDGNSERLIAAALKANRDKIIISGKVGVSFTPVGRIVKKVKPFLSPVKGLFVPFKKKLPNIYRSQRRQNFSSEFIFNTVEGSLNRLQTDYLDLLLLHHPGKAALESGSFCESFESLKTQGKIRFYGVSCDSIEEAILSMELPGVSVIQIALNILDKDPVSAVLPQALEKNIGVIARQPFSQGLLTDQISDTKAENWAYDYEVFKEKKRRAEKLKLSLGENRSIVQIALQYLFQFNEISTVLAGFSSRKHLSEILNSVHINPLSQQELESIYLNNK